VLRLPAAPLRWLGGDMADELLLTGRRVVPDKALRNGFVFRYPSLRAALTAILGPAHAAQDNSGAQTLESARAGRTG
jgi:NAD dependent epimerase/dehydratase family enzyme